MQTHYFMYWRDASSNTLHYCIGVMHLHCQYTTLLYWKDAYLNTPCYCIGGMHLSTHYCIGRMHLSTHYTIVLDGCISQHITLLYWRDASLNTEGCMVEHTLILCFLQSLLCLFATLQSLSQLNKTNSLISTSSCTRSYTSPDFICGGFPSKTYLTNNIN